MSGILVLHEIGDMAGGDRWREVFGPEASVPDLPGHGTAPPPVAGHYELYDAAFAAADILAGSSVELLVGVGKSGWAAQLMGAGGKAEAVALVDGLGGPWADPAAVIAEGAAWVRAIADDPDALEPPPPGRSDPRLRHGVPPMRSRLMAERAAAALSVPVLVVETPDSPLDSADAAELAGLFAGGATVVRLESSATAVVAQAVLGWER